MLPVEQPPIGPYTPVRLLGEGATTYTYLYRHEQRKRYAVFKIGYAPLVTTEAKGEFATYAKQLKKLVHRTIVAVQDFGLHPTGVPDQHYGFLILQYIESEPISRRFVEGKQARPDEIRRVLQPLADALQYASANHLVHGNLHPGNILQNEKDFFLTDFFHPSLSQEGARTESKAILYRAPEHLRGQASAASDQYSLAVMAYEWLCGRRPYLATTRAELLHQQENEPLPAPSSLNPDISPLVEKVLLQALSIDPSARFPHPQTFSDSYLRALMGQLPVIQASPAPAPAPTPVLAPAPAPVSSQAPVEEKKQPVAARSRKSKRAADREVAAIVQVPTSKQPAATPAAAMSVAEQVLTTESAREPAREISLVRERPASSEPGTAPEKPELLPYEIVSDLQLRVEQDLRQGGVLSLALDGYEERPAQIEMASMVARSIATNTPAIIEASTGTGKALDVDTPIPTPTGWKRMGDLQIGDQVFDEQGQPTTVTAAFEIMHNRPCYEVVFSDGSTLIADAEHEWASYTTVDRKKKAAMKMQLLASTFPGQGAYHAFHNRNRHRGPIDRVLPRFIGGLAPDRQLATVANSSSYSQVVRYYSSTCDNLRVPDKSGQDPINRPSMAFSVEKRDFSFDVPIENHAAGAGYTLVTTEQMAATLTIGSSQQPNHAIALAGALALPEADLPMAPYFLGKWLSDSNADNDQTASIHAEKKRIPQLYLRASERQRRALLAGLLDTDGTVNRHGAVEFTTTSSQLAQDVYELVCSLGFRPTLREGIARLKGVDCGPKWTLAFTTDQIVFRLARKIAAQKERLRNYSPERNRFRYVVAVNPVSSRPVRCIQVAAPSHLYLAGRSMVPTHNSLAYLISVVRSGKVAIVSTANKALQEQLFFKDIPFIQKYIRRIDAALVKGMGNYICLDRVEQERIGFQHYVRNRDFMRLVERIQESDERFTGDFEMLGFTLPPDIRSKVNADRDQCTWSKCTYFSDCYVHKMKTRAAQASVIVVNHTLLLLDAFMEGKLLPERDVIIVDEAHHLEEEATRAFTTTISPGQVATLLAQGMLKNHTPLALQEETRETMNLAWEQLARVADPGSKGRANLKEPLQEGLGLASMVEKLADALRTGRPKDMDEKDEQLYDKLITRAQNLAGDIRIVFAVNEPEKYVYYVESVKTGRRGADSKHLEVSAAPLEVTNWLREQLFDKSNVVCTSATLATIGPDPARPDVKGPNFAYFRRRAGLDHNNYPDVQERILPLTFDYEGHALLYLPRHIPEPAYGEGPAEQEYTRAVAREMMKLVEASRGRAFLLFSSRRMLDRVFDIFMSELPSNLKFPLLRQGDMTRPDLVRSFREREGAVLFGLKSFWEGVDIAGEALSLVVIDKLPFDPPDDPVHEARVAQMKAAGENWFGTYVLPQTVLRLKQGLGRLLRTHSDRGVMAILDTRLYTKSYGKQIVQALPPARRAFNMETVTRFFQDPDDEDDDAPF